MKNITRAKLRSQIRKSLISKSKSELKEIIVKSVIENNFISKRFVIAKECTLCGDTEDLQKHHLKPRTLGGDDSINNLITLCSYCHWYLHCNPKFKIHHSKLTKEGLERARLNGKKIGNRGKDKKQRKSRSDKGLIREEGANK